VGLERIESPHRVVKISNGRGKNDGNS